MSCFSKIKNCGRDVKIDDELSNIKVTDHDIPAVIRRDGIRANLQFTWPDVSQGLVNIPKSESEKASIIEALKRNVFLKHTLTDKQRIELIADAMAPQEVHKDEIVIEQGQDGEHMYVCDQGIFQVIKDGTVLNEFSDRIVFGELAVLYNHTRQATIKALTNGRVWKVARDDFKRVMITTVKDQTTEVVSFLKEVPQLKEANNVSLERAGSLFTTVTYTAGTKIVSEGDEGDSFFIIRVGKVRVANKSNGFLANLNRGAYFGEQALLNDVRRRNATVTAESPVVECLVLSCNHFTELFGNLQSFLALRSARSSVEQVLENPEFSHIHLRHLRLRRALGHGGFGRVELAYLRKDEKQTFALKYVKRKHVVDNGQIEHVFNERNIQMACNSPFIVKLYKTYHDQKYLYFLMELCLGGDMISLLQRQRQHCFSEDSTRFYTACVLEAIDYLHQRNIVYRDLKPENMMLDLKGYLKLTDFSFAKKLEHHSKTHTFAGTPEYVAPEMVLQRGHDRAVDYWACGIFIFEMLVGKTPFKSSDPSHLKTFNLILQGIDNVIFPPKVKSAEPLIKKLCKLKPSERLGYQLRGVQDIRDHKWFQGFNWERLQALEMSTPFVPGDKLNGHMNTLFFQEQPRDAVIPPDDNTAALNNF